MKTFLIACALALPACAVDTLPIAKYVADGGPPDGDAGTSDSGQDDSEKPCTTNDDCDYTELCQKQPCGEHEGRCVARQSACDSHLEPVCGCDGLNYFNPCLLSANGQSLRFAGECERPLLCGGPEGLSCPPALGARAYCGKLVHPDAAGCPPDIKGKCWVLPSECGQLQGGDRFNLCGGGSMGGGGMGGGPGPSSGTDGDGTCVDLCLALRSEQLYVRAAECTN